MEFKPGDRVWVYQVIGDGWKEAAERLLNAGDDAIIPHLVMHSDFGCAVLVVSRAKATGFGFYISSYIAIRKPYTHDLGEVTVQGLPPAIATEGEPVEYDSLTALDMMQAGEHPREFPVKIVNETDTQLVILLDDGNELEMPFVFQKADKKGDQ